MSHHGDKLTIDETPTMAGFKWSATPPYVPTVPGEDGWCVRDAVSKLLGWERDSEEWSRFIEGRNRRTCHGSPPTSA
jgi:hypothetical protein